MSVTALSFGQVSSFTMAVPNFFAVDIALLGTTALIGRLPGTADRHPHAGVALGMAHDRAQVAWPHHLLPTPPGGSGPTVTEQLMR
jgi:hypothetical protein